MGKNKTPFMIDPSIYKQAGIDLKTGLPTRAVEGTNLKASMKKVMRLIDEQDAVNRYKWYNLPAKISSEESLPEVLDSVLQPHVEVYKKNLKPQADGKDVVVAGRIG